MSGASLYTSSPRLTLPSPSRDASLSVRRCSVVASRGISPGSRPFVRPLSAVIVSRCRAMAISFSL